MKTMRTTLLGTLAISLLFLSAGPGAVLGGIRLDGTEFQGASDVAGTTTKGGQLESSKLVFTLGQAVMVKGELPEASPGTAFKIGLGYEYNVVHTTAFGCNCPYQGDADRDGFQTAFDLTALIDVLFAGADNVQDQTCPTFRFDADCDGFVTPLDLARVIDFLYANGEPPCSPCESAS
jgi:hypothetical protein